MRKVFVCKHCGSPNVGIDARHYLNNDHYVLRDMEFCEACGKDGLDLTRVVKVPDSFNIYKDRFDVSKLGEMI
jgi:hypothetical protein